MKKETETEIVKPTGQKSLSVILDEIEERASKATSGPWYRGRANGEIVFRSPECLLADCGASWVPRREILDNTVFIASARTDVPALVKALRKAIWAIETLAQEPANMIRSDFSSGIALRHITAILTSAGNGQSVGRGSEEQSAPPLTPNS